MPAAGGALALFAGFFIWASMGSRPNGGEPYAIAIINRPEHKAVNPPPATGEQHAEKPPASAPPPGSRIVTIIDGKSGARQEIVIKNAEPAASSVDAAKLNTGVVDDRLVEASRFGPIPRVAPDGARPLDAYASAAAQTADRRAARIAIVVGGLGISTTSTNEAIAKLPDSVTLAFAPYGNDLTKLAARARATGHEIVLQLPMEPFDYPDNDPGPQTMLSSSTGEQNLQRLHWMMSRIQGYIGVTNYMGARFTATEKAFVPVLRDVSKRGLLYLDDGSSARSVAAKSAQEIKAPFLKADLVVDISPNWGDIDSALAKLEMIAADKGYAIGTATALPVSVERIARWAKAAKARGIRIVPLSAILPKAKQS
ncbi:MAG TPA: divergent polysaccharide deacetylase family protein [Xanthobacteraceae bacterium]|nr:divergent polysaccharide deacetylase family protein [Xanthobacteraceae bacterium]